MTTIPDRVPVPAELEDEALAMLRELLFKRLRYKGSGAFWSTHEAMGHVEEEVREAWVEVQADKPEQLVQELLDIAVGCVHGIASLWALGLAKPPQGFAGLTVAGDHGG